MPQGKSFELPIASAEILELQKSITDTIQFADI
jgi:hypothetical protein